MRYTLVQYKEDLYANFWLIPLVMVLFGVGLAFSLLYLDHAFVFQRLKSHLSLLLSPSNSRVVLSVIATSVITITSVTFSITVLTLSITSNQLGPRLLPNFMRQKSTQFVLGFFIGTFVYSLIVLQFMFAENPNANMPYLSISIGLLLGIISFFLLIYFIHFVCHAIEIDNVLTFLIEDLTNCIERQFADKASNESALSSVHQQLSLQNKPSTVITSDCFGYIQIIDYDALLKIAEKNALQVKVHFGVGKFVFKKLPIMTVYSDAPVSESVVKKCFNILQIGKRRSTVQDIEFAFEELSEIALRALSPGINNPYTAIHCLDRIVQGISVLAKKAMPSREVYDEKGTLRLIRQVPAYLDIVRTAFNRFRQQARFDLSVAIDFLIMIERLLTTTLPTTLRDALTKQAQYVYEDTMLKQMNAEDKKDLKYFYNKIKAVNQ